MKYFLTVILTALVAGGGVYWYMDEKCKSDFTTMEELEHESEKAKQLEENEKENPDMTIDSLEVYGGDLSVVVKNPKFINGEKDIVGEFYIVYSDPSGNVIDEVNIDYYNPFEGDGGHVSTEEPENIKLIWHQDADESNFNLSFAGVNDYVVLKIDNQMGDVREFLPGIEGNKISLMQ